MKKIIRIIIMKNIIVLVIGIFNFCELLYSMEKNATQKPYCITVYSADNQRMLVPLNIMRESNVLYEQYCKKVSEKQERLFLNAPIKHADLSFFVDACKHKEEIFKECYCIMSEHKKTILMDIAHALKSSWAKVRMFDCYYVPEDIQDSIIAMAMPIKDAAESLRYCKIKINLKPEFGVPWLRFERQEIAEDQWAIAYKGDGTYYKAPLCVMKNDTAMWGGEPKDDYEIKIGENIYCFGRVSINKYDLTLGNKNEVKVLYDNINDNIKFIFSNDGQWLVTGSYIVLYCTTFYPLNRQKQEVVSHSWNNQVNVLRFNHQSTLLAIGFANNDNEIILQRMPQEKELLSEIPIYKSLKGHHMGVWDIQFSGDDKCLLTHSRTAIFLWDISYYENIHIIKKITLDEQPIKTFLSKFGNRIVVITDEKYLVYDGSTGECINHEHRGGIELTANGLYDVVFSNDGKFFLTITRHQYFQEAHFKLWDAQTGKEIGQLHQRYIDSNALGFTPDLRYIIDANVSLKDRSYIHCTQLYNDQDEKEIEQIADYKPKNLCDAYAVWRACKAAENGDIYLDGLKSDEIKKIIAASVIKK